MASNKHTVSIYVDQDLLEKLNEFKTNGEFKSLNVALNSFLRESFLGEVSGNVQSKVQSNVSSTLDIEAMITAAIEKQSPVRAIAGDRTTDQCPSYAASLRRTL